MALESIHYQIQQAQANILIANITDFASQDGKITLDPDRGVVIRMLPKDTEQLDVLPCFVVAPYDVDWDPLSFEHEVNVTYYNEIAIVAVNNFDYASKQMFYQSWLEHAMKLLAVEDLEETDPQVESVWRVRIMKPRTFDRSKLNSLYAYQSIVMAFDSQESRT